VTSSNKRFLMITVLVMFVSPMAWRSGRGAESTGSVDHQTPQAGERADQPATQPSTGGPAQTMPTMPTTMPTLNELDQIGDPGDTIIKRIPKLEMYPCSDCHSTPADFNATPRTMTKEHTDKKVHFQGRNDNAEWCHRCHKEGNYLKLNRHNGKEVSFNEAYLLCGECHGTQYNDWRRNIHGKRVGSWNGPKQVYSCPECHDPHAPAFKPMKPEPMPIAPRGRSKSFLKLLFGDMIHDTGEVHKETQPSR